MEIHMKAVTTAQAEYRLNHSELRGIARADARVQRKTQADALTEVCRSRLFWLGDKWSRPSTSEGAKAALITLRDTRYDSLAAMQQFRAKCPADQTPTFLRVASPSTSAASALRLAYAGETVYARRKVEPRRYGWVVVGVGK